MSYARQISLSTISKSLKTRTMLPAFNRGLRRNNIFAMSVYIKVTDAQWPSAQAKQYSLTIRGRGSELRVQSLSAHLKPTWNASFICSIKEKTLMFVLTDSSSQTPLAEGELFFSPIRAQAEQQFTDEVQLNKGGKVNVEIFYTRRKNYIGTLQFYEFQSFTTHESSIIKNSVLSEKQAAPMAQIEPVFIERTQSLPIEQKQPLELKAGRGQKPKEEEKDKKGGFFNFFCCGEQNPDDILEEIEEDDRAPYGQYDKSLKAGKESSSEAPSPQFSKQLETPENPQVKFYKGPCESKNLFSMCDAGGQDNKFTVVENYYRD